MRQRESKLGGSVQEVMEEMKGGNGVNIAKIYFMNVGNFQRNILHTYKLTWAKKCKLEEQA